MSTRRFARHAVPGPRPGTAPCWVLLACMALTGLLLAATGATAHSVEMTSGSGPACWVMAEYAGMEPMAFAKVKILNPQGQTHQVGNADALGRFAWLPDQAGRWSAVAEDGMGHRGEISLAWKKTPSLLQADDPPSQSASQASWVARISGGLSVIFWLSGLAFWWQGRRKRLCTRRD